MGEKTSEKTGYIYVLTNESFHMDNWVKIGYTEDVDRRVKDLSNTAVPFPYEVYCTYEIPRISGTKDPDKLLHDLIQKLNPGLRISPNREFFEMFPWDAYDMLLAIAQMHGREDKLKKNNDNSSDRETQEENEYSVEKHFPYNTEKRRLYELIKEVVMSVDSSLEEISRKYYVAYRTTTLPNNRNILSLWPRSNWIEVVLCARTGKLKDDYDLVYDISSRKWGSEQYAFRFNDDTDKDAIRNIIEQVIKLKI